MTFSPEPADWTQARGRRDNLCLPSVRPLSKRAGQTSATRPACFRGDEIRLDGRAFPERATCQLLFYAPQHFLESAFVAGLPVQSLQQLKDQQLWFLIPAHWFVPGYKPVSYTHLRAHETGRNLVCRLLLEKKKTDSSRR